MLVSIVGNVASIYFPYRIAWEGTRSVARGPIAALVGLINIVLVTLLTLPSALCLVLEGPAGTASRYRGISPGMILAMAMLAAAFVTYALSLRPTGKLLFRREQKLLDALVRDTE